MNRRTLLLTLPHAVVGTVIAARLLNEPLPKPVARLINNDKGTWYNGRGTTDADVCRDNDALVYEPDDLKGDALTRWWQDMDQLVKDNYAEWII